MVTVLWHLNLKYTLGILNCLLHTNLSLLWGGGCKTNKNNNIIHKVKNDHCSKFSNLSNWKEEAWKNQGFNGIQPCDLRDTSVMLYHRYRGGHRFESRWSPDFFRLLLSNCLNWKIYSDDHSLLWSNTAVHIYELFHIYFMPILFL